MSRLLVLLLLGALLGSAAELPSKKWLNLAAIKTMVAAAEAEAQQRGVDLTLCVTDDAGNVIFLQKADGAGLVTLEFAQKKARYAALYGNPSKHAADLLGAGNLQILAFPSGFPNQGGLPIKVDGRTIGGIAASGAASAVDEAVAQAGLDALFKE